MSESVTATATSETAAPTEAVAADVAPTQAAAPAAPTEAPAPVDPVAALWADKPEGETVEAKAETEEKSEAKADALPEVYEVALPEGVTVDPNLMEAYQGFLKDRGLTQEQANDMTPALLALKSKFEQQALDAWADTTRGWREAVERDPEIGGTKLQAALVNVAVARDQFGNIPEFRELMSNSNLALYNHPGMIKFLAAVGKAASEDQRGLERQAPKPALENTASAVGARMFPNMSA